MNVIAFDEEEFAQPPVLHELMQGRELRHEAVHVADSKPNVCRRHALHQVPGVRLAGSHGLLAQDVLAVRECRETMLVVQMVGRAHGNDVHVVPANGCFHVGGGSNPVKLLPCLRQSLFIGIAENDKTHTGYLPIRAHVTAPYAKTDDRDAKFVHVYTFLDYFKGLLPEIW